MNEQLENFALVIAKECEKWKPESLPAVALSNLVYALADTLPEPIKQDFIDTCQSF